MPMILTSRLSNSGLIFAMYPSSVVHTGVKSFGCENSTAQELPIQVVKLDAAGRGVGVEVGRRISNAQGHLKPPTGNSVSRVSELQGGWPPQ